LNISDFSTPLSANALWIDALVSGQGVANWNWLVPTRNTVRYTFATTPELAVAVGVSNFAASPFNNVQQAATRQLLAYVTSVTGIQFAETSSPVADMHFATADISDPGHAGEAAWRVSYTYDVGDGSVTTSTLNHYVFLDNREHLSGNAAPTPGNSAYEVLLHEIGHALGLKHPFDDFPTLPASMDNTSQTVMSYTHVGGPYSRFNELDLAALAYLYGFDGVGGSWGVGTGGRYYQGTSGDETFTSGSGRFAWVGLGGVDRVSFVSGLGSSTLSITPDSGWIVVDQPGSTNYVAPSIEALIFPDNAVSYPELLRGVQVSASTRFGTSAADILNGSPGNDVLFARSGDDSIVGLSGTDTAIYQGPRSAYVVNRIGSPSELRFTVTDSANRDGTDSILGIERLRFTDRSTALDLQGAAGMTAKLLGAVFGASQVQNGSFVGVGLTLFDAGFTYEQVAARAASDAFFAQLAGSHSNRDFVNHVYRNVVGTLPSMDDLNFFVGLLDSGVHTQATLAVLAAETPLNQQNINLIGLQQTGLDYL
jgi:serralysin